MKPSQKVLTQPAIGKIGEKITSLTVKDKSDRDLLNKNASFVDYTVRNITVYQPVFTLSETHLIKGEKLLFKIAIRVYTGEKVVKNSKEFDGVMFVTNQRVLFRFIDQFNSLEKEYQLSDLRLSLGNEHNKDRLSQKLKLIEDPESHPYLKVNDGELKVWLMTDDIVRNGRITHHRYVFAGYNMYVGLTEALHGIREFMHSSDPESFVSQRFEEGVDLMYGKKNAGMWVIYLLVIVFILFVCGFISIPVLAGRGNEEAASDVFGLMCLGFIAMFGLAFVAIIGLSIYSRIRRNSPEYKEKVQSLLSRPVQYD